MFLNVPNHLFSPAEKPLEPLSSTTSYSDIVSRARQAPIQGWFSRLKRIFSYFSTLFKEIRIYLHTDRTKYQEAGRQNFDFLTALHAYGNDQGIESSDIAAITGKYLKGSRPLTSYTILKIDADIKKKIIEEKMRKVLSAIDSKMGVSMIGLITKEVKENVYHAIEKKENELEKKEIKSSGLPYKEMELEIEELFLSEIYKKYAISKKMMENHLLQICENGISEIGKIDKYNIGQILKLRGKYLIPNEEDSICDAFFLDFNRGFYLVYDHTHIHSIADGIPLGNTERELRKELAPKIKNLIPDEELRASLSILANQAIEFSTSVLVTKEWGVSIKIFSNTVSYESKSGEVSIKTFYHINSFLPNEEMPDGFQLPTQLVVSLGGEKKQEGVIIGFERKFILEKEVDGKYTKMTDFQYCKPSLSWGAVDTRHRRMRL